MCLNTSRRYVFELPNNEASLLPIASCVVVKASEGAAPLVGKNGKPIIRPYTPVSPSDQEGEFTFLIKRYEEGKMSQYIHNLKPGETLGIKGPIMKIPYKSTLYCTAINNCRLPNVPWQRTSSRRSA